MTHYHSSRTVRSIMLLKTDVCGISQTRNRRYAYDFRRQPNSGDYR